MEGVDRSDVIGWVWRWFCGGTTCPVGRQPHAPCVTTKVLLVHYEYSTRGQGPHRPRTSYNKSTSLPTHGITQSEIKIATRPKPGCTSHRPPAPSLPRMPLRRSGPQRTSRFPSGHRGVSCSCIVIPYVRGELTCEGGRRRLTLLLVARRPPLCPERTRRRDSLHSSLRIEV
jgi:hypothetical protein